MRTLVEAKLRLSRTVVATPLGNMLAMSSERGLCALEFMNKRLTRLERRLDRWFPAHDAVDERSSTIERTITWLDLYFAGVSADVADLPLDMRGADFELRVWKRLLKIPPGATTSYGAIAKELDSIGASRAVGLANGANPIAIIVPCHRVIGSTGALTGYGGGLDRKTWLIDHERRWRQDTLF
ncbi:MAG TPA: methylated-DNA--[protein]-cysteine S-methyltransferase [Vicinamibacterales bacterium]|jgi:O-6-methylguanine DNA methyltransferase